MKRSILSGLCRYTRNRFPSGDHEDKSSLYQIPYKNMVKYMFKMPDDNSFELLYTNLKAQALCRSGLPFIRGTISDNAILLIDEAQNLNFHELDSIPVLVRTLASCSVVMLSRLTL